MDRNVSRRNCGRAKAVGWLAHAGLPRGEFLAKQPSHPVVAEAWASRMLLWLTTLFHRLALSCQYEFGLEKKDRQSPSPMYDMSTRPLYSLVFKVAFEGARNTDLTDIVKFVARVVFWQIPQETCDNCNEKVYTEGNKSTSYSNAVFLSSHNPSRLLTRPRRLQLLLDQPAVTSAPIYRVHDHQPILCYSNTVF